MDGWVVVREEETEDFREKKKDPQTLLQMVDLFLPRVSP